MFEQYSKTTLVANESVPSKAIGINIKKVQESQGFDQHLMVWERVGWEKV
jgi:hypothetical protein